MYVRYESSKYLVPRMFFSFLTLADLAMLMLLQQMTPEIITLIFFPWFFL